MFGIELFGILILLAIVALVVLALLPGGSTYDVADETIVHGVSVDIADQVLFRELSDVPGLPLIESHAGSYTLRRKSVSGAAILGAILLFPIGLLFLLFTREHRVQISLAEHPAGCRLRIVGTAKGRDIDRVAETIRRVLPVPETITR